MKIDGLVTPVKDNALDLESAKAMCYAIMNDRQVKEFEATKECNFAISPAGIGRFRVNAFVQQGAAGLVIRAIETEVPNIEKLGLPEVLKDVIMTKRGLVIMVGGTGSGKSTTMRSFMGFLNSSEGSLKVSGIDTIANPVEAKEIIGYLPGDPQLPQNLNSRHYLNLVQI